MHIFGNVVGLGSRNVWTSTKRKVSVLVKFQKTNFVNVIFPSTTNMADLIKVKGMTYDTTYFVGKWQEHGGKIIAMKENEMRTEVTGKIFPEMMTNIKENLGEEYVDFQVWLALDQSINPFFSREEDFMNALWLH